MTNYPELKQAVDILAGRCDFAFRQDGIGFNKFDTQFGHELADLPTWTPKQARATWEILRKYREQLKGFGIAYDAIPEPPAQNGNGRTIDVDGDIFIIRFPYDNGLVAAIRELPGRRWNSQMKFNTAPVTELSVVWLKTFASKYDFIFTDKALALIDNPPDNLSAEAIKATINSSKIVVSITYKCPNFYEALTAVKSLLGRKWDDDKKVWLVPLNEASSLLKALNEFDNFAPSDELVKLTREQEQTKQELSDTAIAQSSDFEVEGLGGTLYPFQKAGVEYAVKTQKCIIADEMGLGKTVEALATIKHLNAFPVIIVCPAAVKINWAREVKKWLPGHSVEIWSGRNGNDNPAAEIVVLNYDILEAKLESLLALNPQAVIFDELHYCKNFRAKRTKAAKTLAKKAQVRLGLTGTPILNRPNELISPLQILGRLEEFGGFWHFAKHFCDAHQNYFGWDFSGAANLNELHDKLKATCFIRRRKEDVLPELPEKTRAIIPVEIDNWGEYAKAEKDLIAWVGQRAIEDEEFLASIGMLDETEQKWAKQARIKEATMRAKNAEQLVRIEALKQLAVKGKMRAIVDWVTNFLESDEKLVIFAHHREIVETLTQELKEYGATMIIGGQSAEDRDEAVQRFQEDKNCQVIISSIKAGGIGITLTAASNVVFTELGWTPAEMSQAEDRLHRIGQKNNVLATYLLGANTIEEEIASLLDEKKTVIDATTDGIETDVAQGILAALMKALQEE